MTIALIVDDHAIFRAGLATLLRSQCFFHEVVEAAALDEALDILGAKPDVTLAIFDLAMPGMVSAASLCSVRERFPTVHVVVMTGSNSRHDIFIALNAGVHGFILKTISTEGIVTALRWILDGNVYVPIEITQADPAQSIVASPPSVPDPFEKLTPRQREILHRLASGRKSNKEIARELDLTENTVKVHIIAIYRALGIHDRRQIPTVLKALEAAAQCV